ncbi:MAG: replication-associated recombination protein A [Candidatus Wallbacteria bacterium]|nr:replication-associated recombination protein A [Candidatus Wallbacteria bacterium]
MSSPLAGSIRPETVDEIIGQQQLFGPDKPLRTIFEKGVLTSSLLFTGPPGCGKTTAALLFKKFPQDFHILNAVTSNVQELKEIIASSIGQLSSHTPIIFIDEIHRFNSKQQDALLPYVEEGSVLLVATSTLSAYKSVTRPLLSRLNVFRFHALKISDILKILRKGEIFLKIKPFSDNFHGELAKKSDGDARMAVNYLEMCADRLKSVPEAGEQELLAGLEFIPVQSSKTSHYDYISAFIKSLRGSDPDAALYYLAVMLKLGEDPRFIARRMIIFASEDIGNADPAALTLAISVMGAVEQIGLPEARINLAHGVTYLACSRKSNASYLGLKRAEKECEENALLPVPGHLRNFGPQSKDYQYPHNFPGHYVEQQYLADKKRFYEPTEIGEERKFRDYLSEIRSRR